MIENNWDEIYAALKGLPKDNIKKEIDDYFKKYGMQFLESLIANAILDIEASPTNPNPNQIITYIEKYSERLSNQEERKKNLSKILGIWQVRLVAIGTFGLFVLEFIKFLFDYF